MYIKRVIEFAGNMTKYTIYRIYLFIYFTIFQQGNLLNRVDFQQGPAHHTIG